LDPAESSFAGTGFLRLVDRLGLVLAGAIALFAPLGYFTVGYAALTSTLASQTEIKAESISRLISVSLLCGSSRSIVCMKWRCVSRRPRRTSAFGYLKNLPVDYIKIDGSFVREIEKDSLDRAMVEMINRVGHLMGVKTVGESAETGLIIAELKSIGVDFAQGSGSQMPLPLPISVVGRAVAAGDKA
jgi:hypothetical protein